MILVQLEEPDSLDPLDQLEKLDPRDSLAGKAALEPLDCLVPRVKPAREAVLE